MPNLKNFKILQWDEVGKIGILVNYGEFAKTSFSSRHTAMYEFDNFHFIGYLKSIYNHYTCTYG